MHHKLHWKLFLLQEGYGVHSSMQMLRTLLWALLSSSYAAFKLTPLLSCSMYNPVSTEHSIIIYCDTHLWLSFFIFIPVRVRVPVATIQLHLSWRWWFLILLASFRMWPSTKLLVIICMMMLKKKKKKLYWWLLKPMTSSNVYRNVLTIAYMGNWWLFWCWLLPWPLKPHVDL